MKGEISKIVLNFVLVVVFGCIWLYLVLLSDPIFVSSGQIIRFNLLFMKNYLNLDSANRNIRFSFILDRTDNKQNGRK